MHPRPQLVRDRWIDLCGEWRFGYDDADRGRDERWQDASEPFDRVSTVPFPPEAKASGIGDSGRHPVVWYRRTFRLPEADRAERLLLHFGAVDYRASVWVNGALVVEHEGGHTPFHADITPALRADEAEQVIVVRAEDLPEDRGQPRGKQCTTAEPDGIWHRRTTGIWQPVWLEPVAAQRITALRWLTEVPRRMVDLRLSLANPQHTTLAVRVVLRLGDQILTDDTYRTTGTTLHRQIALPTVETGPLSDPLLWTPERPTLIDAELTVSTGNDVLDQVRSYLGFREVAVRDGHFLLNRSQYFLRMVLEQGYWPASHLAAPDEDALRWEAELIKSLGFNGARIHQKIEDPRFLYWCDRLGLLVWGEMPSVHEFSDTAIDRLTAEWLAALHRDISHPCIVAWVPLNESWGVPDIATQPAQQHFAGALYHLTRSVDPSRPVIANDGWEYLHGDILGVHDYAALGAELRQRYGDAAALDRSLRTAWPGPRRVLLAEPARPDTPVMITEFGGLSYAPEPGERWFAYDTVGDPTEFAARYTDLTAALLDSPHLAGFWYTQFTDTEQETNGLLTADRAHKLDPAAVRAANTAPAASVPPEQTAANRHATRSKAGPL